MTNIPQGYDEGSTLHSHRCMRCGEEFVCKTPEICRAQYNVLPNIVTLDDDGNPRITPHCPPNTQRATGLRGAQ